MTRELTNTYKAIYAGYPVVYRFRIPYTYRYFGSYAQQCEETSEEILLPEEIIAGRAALYPEGTKKGYIEYKELIPYTAGHLLRYKCSIFHAVSFIFRGKAWLLTAPSGTGKTTQYMNWVQLHPNEIIVISGDMPVLAMNHSRSIQVCPSPWNGKEKIGNAVSAELGGIIILNQDKSNSIRFADKKESILTLFSQFMAIPESKEEIRILSDMIQRIVAEVPIWVFSNTGTVESTMVLRQTIEDYLALEVNE